MKKKLQQYVSALETLQKITETYQEISSGRIRRTKDYILHNRSFYDPLLEVYQVVNDIYFHVNHRPYRKKTNSKTLSLLLTSNTGLYGPINRSIFDLFLREESQSQNDLAVAGKLGKLWLEKAGFQRHYDYFDLEDALNLDSYNARKLLDHMFEYSEVKIYHGLFNNVISQTAKITKIAKPSLPDTQGKTLSFIFEPSIERVLEVFEKQLLGSFFTQVMLESNLAKNGSRMMSLDNANQNIRSTLDKIRSQSLLVKHRLMDKRQQEQAVALFAWRCL